MPRRAENEFCGGIVGFARFRCERNAGTAKGEEGITYE